VKEVNKGGGFARDQSNGWAVAVTVGAFIVCLHTLFLLLVFGGGS
jgi:hypothetical protein